MLIETGMQCERLFVACDTVANQVLLHKHHENVKVELNFNNQGINALFLHYLSLLNY